jgi:hypothetical protein
VDLLLDALPYNPQSAALYEWYHADFPPEIIYASLDQTVQEMNHNFSETTGSATPDRRFIFTISTGRSGTNFLADLFASNLSGAQVHHEQLTYRDWGVNSPELSHLTRFNHVGNSDYVREFWRQKFDRVKALDVRYFAETSHVLAKAGLVENLDQLQGSGEVHLIYLKRDIAETIISFVNRADFLNRGNMWLWYLDPAYPNVIVKPEPFTNLGQIGYALWYVIEMRVRAEYYRLLMAGRAGIVVHELDMEAVTRIDGATKLLTDVGMVPMPVVIRMPGRVNASSDRSVDQSTQQHIREVVGRFKFDAADLARRWYDGGHRLSRRPEDAPANHL